MKEIRYSEKIQDKQTLSDSKGIWPDINKLKDKFKEGSIPLQTDFNQLIDIADIGRKATGQAPNQNGPAQGMRLGEDGLLKLKLSENDENYVDGYHSPLVLRNDVLGVGVGEGLMTYQGSHNIGVNPGNGLRVDGGSVTVKLATNKGLDVDSNGIAIKPGYGMQFSSDGALQLKLNAKYADGYHSPLVLRNDVLGVGVSNGLITYKNSNEIGVNPGNGLRIDGDSVTVKLADNKGLAIDSNGIAIKPGNGIKVDADGVAIDPNTVLPTGMIAMFSDRNVPKGWIICNGSSNTPNLLDKSIHVNNPYDNNTIGGIPIGYSMDFNFYMKL
ncbi:hypothetical protein [Xenorhabdus bovienii]|uniref:hypothetical protein n=1 Tax=Xenorhabdus bovienii TaxID=40576 RepID=UPI00215872A1|nr:hypothetical protein [Xenorhabdus bovienii]